MRRSDEQIEVERPVLTVFKCSESVEDQRFNRSALRTQQLMEKQTMSAQAISLSLKSAVGNVHLSTDLSQTRSAHEPVEERLQQVCVPKPVCWRERLSTEVTIAIMTSVPLNSVWLMGSNEKSLLCISPTP